MLPKLKHQALRSFAVMTFIFLPAAAAFAETIKSKTSKYTKPTVSNLVLLLVIHLNPPTVSLRGYSGFFIECSVL